MMYTLYTTLYYILFKHYSYLRRADEVFAEVELQQVSVGLERRHEALALACRRTLTVTTQGGRLARKAVK